MEILCFYNRCLFTISCSLIQFDFKHRNFLVFLIFFSYLFLSFLFILSNEKVQEVFLQEDTHWSQLALGFKLLLKLLFTSPNS